MSKTSMLRANIVAEVRTPRAEPNTSSKFMQQPGKFKIAGNACRPPHVAKMMKPINLTVTGK